MTHRARPRTRWITAATALLAAVAALAGGTGSGTAEAAAPGQRTQHIEYFAGPAAEPRQVSVPARPAEHDQAARRPARQAAVPAVRPLERTGPVSGRLDLVVMGDGYTADEQGDFAADAEEKLDAIFAVEPYRSYRGLFNVWLVDTVSAESGVSGDPTADVGKDTAARFRLLLRRPRTPAVRRHRRGRPVRPPRPGRRHRLRRRQLRQVRRCRLLHRRPAADLSVPRRGDDVLRQRTVVPHRSP
ncbi:hypothetical protein GCM10017687_07830 [Streptomyces echinatus]